MKYDADSHGTTHREDLKRSMEQPFVAYNRRQKPRKDQIDVTTFFLGWIIVAIVIGVAAAQVAIRHGWIP